MGVAYVALGFTEATKMNTIFSILGGAQIFKETAKIDKIFSFLSSSAGCIKFYVTQQKQTKSLVPIKGPGGAGNLFLAAGLPFERN